MADFPDFARSVSRWVEKASRPPIQALNRVTSITALPGLKTVPSRQDGDPPHSAASPHGFECKLSCWRSQVKENHPIQPLSGRNHGTQRASETFEGGISHGYSQAGIAIDDRRSSRKMCGTTKDFDVFAGRMPAVRNCAGRATQGGQKLRRAGQGSRPC